MKTQLNYSLICVLIFALSACSSRVNTSSRVETIKMPISINIRADESVTRTDLNADLYRFKVKEYLDHYKGIELVLVEKDEDANVVLDIEVKNFQISQKIERNTSRSFKRTIQVGTDAKGNPIYQTETTTVYVESVEIPSSTRLSASFTFKDPSYKVSPQNYYGQYTWRDSGRSVSGYIGSLYNGSVTSSRLPNGEPFAEDFLFTLSGDMLTRVTYDLRRFYQKLKKDKGGQIFLSANP